jgi:hypothetical protein
MRGRRRDPGSFSDGFVSDAAFADVGLPIFESTDMRRIGDLLDRIPLAPAGAGPGGLIYAEFSALVLNDSHISCNFCSTALTHDTERLHAGAIRDVRFTSS